MPSAPLGGVSVDRATQRWVIATGRAVCFSEQRWLDGPVGSPEGIGDGWIAQHACRIGARANEGADDGLLPELRVCDGADFAASQLQREVRDFYRETARWELDVWARWSRWAEPGGRLLNAVFASRLRQLALPLDPLQTAYGMASRVITFTTDDGAHLGTAWQRTLRATGATVFGGFYGIASLPRASRPSVRVSFPLPNGSVTVFLRPEHGPNGSLRLVSPPGRFGQEGAYLVVRAAASDRGWARRVPLHERFDVFVDEEGSLRCEHQLMLHRAEVLRLHYRMRPRQP